MSLFWTILVPALIIWSVVLTFRQNIGYSEEPVWQRPKLPIWAYILIALVSIFPILNWAVIGSSIFSAMFMAEDLIGKFKWWGGIPKWLTKKI